jgi:hypothetical protein
MFIKLLNDHLNGLIKTAGNEKKKIQGKVLGRWVDVLWMIPNTSESCMVGSFAEIFRKPQLTNRNMQARNQQIQ